MGVDKVPVVSAVALLRQGLRSCCAGFWTLFLEPLSDRPFVVRVVLGWLLKVLGAKTLVKVSLDWREMGYVRVTFGALYVESQCSWAR